MKELDTENANGIADDDDLLMKEHNFHNKRV